MCAQRVHTQAHTIAWAKRVRQGVTLCRKYTESERRMWWRLQAKAAKNPKRKKIESKLVFTICELDADAAAAFVYKFDGICQPCIVQIVQNNICSPVAIRSLCISLSRERNYISCTIETWHTCVLVAIEGNARVVYSVDTGNVNATDTTLLLHTIRGLRAMCVLYCWFCCCYFVR